MDADRVRIPGCLCPDPRLPDRGRAAIGRTASIRYFPFLTLIGCLFVAHSHSSTNAFASPLAVLWDTAHTGSNPLPANHSELRDDQVDTTFTFKTAGQVTAADLAGIDLYVLVESDSADLTTSEVTTLRTFLDRGGCLLLLTDTEADNAGVNALLAGSGIAQADPYMGTFTPTADVTSHPITAGVGSFFVLTGGKTFTVTSPAVSCVRFQGETIVAASDRVVAIGDETSFVNGFYTEHDNAVLMRNIFNWFRLMGTPGILELDADVYPTTGVVGIELLDKDLAAATTASVEATSSRGDTETVELANIGPGQFASTIALSPVAPVGGDGLLSVIDGSAVAVIYHDANHGQGQQVDVTTTAAVDGQPPTITLVTIGQIGPFSARVHWVTDEPATSLVRFGRATGATTRVLAQSDLRTTHEVELRWLYPETVYSFVVESSDIAGNRTVADDGGAPFSFATCYSSRTTAPIVVLLIYSDVTIVGVNDMRPKLLADDRIGQVQPWNFHAQLPTPTALAACDVVLLHINLSLTTRVALGDRLADFVEAGGGVVALNRATVDPYAVSGRFRDRGYGVLAVSSSYGMGTSLTLGQVYLPAHPLLEGVHGFEGGTASRHQTQVALTTDSLRIADWSDGEPLVACRTVGDARLVGLNFFGPSSDASSELWNAATDGARLMTNALVWASRALECEATTPPIASAIPDWPQYEPMSFPAIWPRP